MWLLRFQVGVVYAFAGLAKLQPDWLVRALPLRALAPGPGRRAGPRAGWSSDRRRAHVLRRRRRRRSTASIVPLLLWRRTRLAAWLVLVAFHVCTWALFPIGVFPWLMIGVSTVFFEPDWPRRLRSPARRPSGRRCRRVPAGAALAGRWLVAGGGCGSSSSSPCRCATSPTPATTAGPGQGYRFAWNVLLVEKAGSVTFLVHEPGDGPAMGGRPRPALHAHPAAA